MKFVFQLLILLQAAGMCGLYGASSSSDSGSERKRLEREYSGNELEAKRQEIAPVATEVDPAQFFYIEPKLIPKVWAHTSQDTLEWKAAVSAAEGVKKGVVKPGDALTLFKGRRSLALLAKAVYLTIPWEVSFSTDDNVVRVAPDMNVYPQALLPYFGGVSLVDLIDFGFIKKIIEKVPFSYLDDEAWSDISFDFSNLFIKDLKGLELLPGLLHECHPQFNMDFSDNLISNISEDDLRFGSDIDELSIDLTNNPIAMDPVLRERVNEIVRERIEARVAGGDRYPEIWIDWGLE